MGVVLPSTAAVSLRLVDPRKKHKYKKSHRLFFPPLVSVSAQAILAGRAAVGWRTNSLFGRELEQEVLVWMRWCDRGARAAGSGWFLRE